VYKITDIAIVYDRSETDEMGIRLTAEEKGINLLYLPFHKIVVSFGNNGFDYFSIGKNYMEMIDEVKVVLNRTQSKNRRIFASAIFEGMNKKVLNSLSVELCCQSKIRTLIAFLKGGVKIPKTSYIPSNVKEIISSDKDVKVIDNSRVLSKLISRGLNCGKVVLKPDEGTHGIDVRLADNFENLINSLRNYSPSITNPSGIVAQEFIPKWFYDLRIVVEKEKKRPAFCYPTALARGGFKDFRTNTFLGNMVFRANLPSIVQKEAVKCGEVIGSGSEAWVLALDAMPRIGDEMMLGEKELKGHFDALERPFGVIRKVKQAHDNSRGESVIFLKTSPLSFCRVLQRSLSCR